MDAPEKAPTNAAGARPVCDYRQTDAEVEELTGRLIERFPLAGDARYVGYRVAGTDELSDVGRHIERLVFESTFAGNDAHFMVAEYGPYEDASLFFLTVDRALRRPMGVLRIIGNSSAGFKTVNDLSSGRLPVHLPVDDIEATHGITDWNACWDVATVAVAEAYRRTAAKATLQLYRAMYVSALDAGIDHLVAIIDKTPLLAMTEYLSIPFKPLCGTGYFPYLESAESRAVHGYMPDFDPVITARLAEIHDDPVASGALAYIIRGTADHALALKSSPVGPAVPAADR